MYFILFIFFIQFTGSSGLLRSAPFSEEGRDTVYHKGDNELINQMKSLYLSLLSVLGGRWVLPCTSCDNSASCYWREAVWAPHKCRYNVMSRDDARTCLANKKVRIF